MSPYDTQRHHHQQQQVEEIYVDQDGNILNDHLSPDEFEVVEVFEQQVESSSSQLSDRRGQ